MILLGNCLDILPTLPDNSVQCCVTSPPYWGLRDYGTAQWEGGDAKCDHKVGRFTTPASDKQRSNAGSGEMQARDVCPMCGAVRVDAQLGLEPTPEAYVAKMVQVFREVRRVLRDDGTLWLNLGDSYAGSNCGSNDYRDNGASLSANSAKYQGQKPGLPSGLKPKDLVGIPWRVAFALQADGWWLRQDIIWCLSGGTTLYVKSQKGVMPMTVKDMARLNPSTVKLWDGEKWTQLLGVSRSARRGDEIEIVLRSGERISCTPNHKFPTNRGLVEARYLTTGDVLERVPLPECEQPKDCAIDNDAAWLAGLYLAEGSRSDDCIQIAGHAKETVRLERCLRIAAKYGGSATYSVDGNKLSIRLYGRVIVAILDELVSGKTAKDKGFASVVWRYSNSFIESMLDGYLSGDGGWDDKNNRWRLGFTRNYNLERDLRTACARLGYHLVLNLASVKYGEKDVPTFRGEIRKTRSAHHNCKDSAEIVDVRKARCRYVYDLGVADEPHVFSLASGILTHNSKPNPMPESVTDRCTKAHEYLFLLTKSARYYYDNEAIKEPEAHTYSAGTQTKGKHYYENSGRNDEGRHNNGTGFSNGTGMRNRRDVWTIATQPYREAHFAVMPTKLVEPCILAGSRPGDTVLDPFSGAGTVGVVAAKLGREYIGIELNPNYVEMSERRIAQVQPLLVTV